ncbi:replication-relaxation family protein [Saccharococcus sp. Marseille-Q5394]|uniref:replication-relaxation family protein n=1 Tax=Saccharococcus sp. Marseille-Q5394 TaxID=2972778 RepID=UPI0021C84767|nr:replication-relaxation family protein [Saccharococcus sp. Marseille-Q5394]
MARANKKQVVKILQPLDIAILTGLYEYRALSTEQIMRRYELSRWYTYKKLRILRNSRLISTHPISGYLVNQNRQGSYHRISETGISCLRKQGVPVERRADQLRINVRHLPFLLSTNDVMIDLEAYGWQMEDSRRVKAKFELNRGANVQGMLKSPRGTEYLFYMFLHGVGMKNLMKVSNELMDVSNPNYILFAKSAASYKTIVEHLSTNTSVIVQCQSLKVFPYTFAKYYLRHFDDEQNVMRFLEDFKVHDLSFKTDFKDTRRKIYDGLERIVRHEGEEKYLVNLLDTDLVKIYNVRQYRKEMYELDGRKVLLITTSMTRPMHEQLLGEIHHVDYLEIDSRKLIDYLKAIQPVPSI